MLSPRALPWERYHGDLTSSSPPRASAARASLRAGVGNSHFNRGSEVVFALSRYRCDSARRSSRSPTMVSLRCRVPGALISRPAAGGGPKVATDTDNLRLTIIFSKWDGFV